MYTVFLAGGIASGKSTVARELERLGATRIDLDQLSREVLVAGSPCLAEVTSAFGEELLDPVTGELDRSLLASRVFGSKELLARLEQIELPHIRSLLRRRLHELAISAVPCAVVEVPLLDRAVSLLDLADEVLCVCCPHERRLAHAVGRGMDVEDFERRLGCQPSDEYLRSHADTIIENTGSLTKLLDRVRVWWYAHGNFVQTEGRDALGT